MACGTNLSPSGSSSARLATSSTSGGAGTDSRLGSRPQASATSATGSARSGIDLRSACASRMRLLRRRRRSPSRAPARSGRRPATDRASPPSHSGPARARRRRARASRPRPSGTRDRCRPDRPTAAAPPRRRAVSPWKQERGDARERVLLLGDAYVLRARHRVLERHVGAALHEADQRAFPAPSRGRRGDCASRAGTPGRAPSPCRASSAACPHAAASPPCRAAPRPARAPARACAGRRSTTPTLAPRNSTMPTMSVGPPLRLGPFARAPTPPRPRALGPSAARRRRRARAHPERRAGAGTIGPVGGPARRRERRQRRSGGGARGAPLRLRLRLERDAARASGWAAPSAPAAGRRSRSRPRRTARARASASRLRACSNESRRGARRVLTRSGAGESRNAGAARRGGYRARGGGVPAAGMGGMGPARVGSSSALRLVGARPCSGRTCTAVVLSLIESSGGRAGCAVACATSAATARVPGLRLHRTEDPRRSSQSCASGSRAPSWMARSRTFSARSASPRRSSTSPSHR